MGVKGERGIRAREERAASRLVRKALLALSFWIAIENFSAILAREARKKNSVEGCVFVVVFCFLGSSKRVVLHTGGKEVVAECGCVVVCVYRLSAFLHRFFCSSWRRRSSFFFASARAVFFLFSQASTRKTVEEKKRPVDQGAGRWMVAGCWEEGGASSSSARGLGRKSGGEVYEAVFFCGSRRRRGRRRRAGRGRTESN